MLQWPSVSLTPLPSCCHCTFVMFRYSHSFCVHCSLSVGTAFPRLHCGPQSVPPCLNRSPFCSFAGRHLAAAAAVNVVWAAQRLGIAQWHLGLPGRGGCTAWGAGVESCWHQSLRVVCMEAAPSKGRCCCAISGRPVAAEMALPEVSARYRAVSWLQWLKPSCSLHSPLFRGHGNSLEFPAALASCFTVDTARDACLALLVGAVQQLQRSEGLKEEWQGSAIDAALRIGAISLLWELCLALLERKRRTKRMRPAVGGR